MIDVGDNGKVADVCAIHADGARASILAFSDQRAAFSSACMKLKVAIMLHGLPVRADMRYLRFGVILILAATCFAQPQQQSTKDFIRVQSPVIALEHVRVIDGTGTPARADQTIVISGGKITAIGKVGAVSVPADANRMDFTGYRSE